MDTHASAERLALLVHLAQVFNASLDLDEVLRRVMDEVIQAVHAERGFVMLRDAQGSLDFRAARGIDQTTIGDPGFQVSRSIVARVAGEGAPLLTSDAQSDARFNMRQSVMILGLRSILCVPLRLAERVLGVIYVDNRMQAGIFTSADMDLLSAIASSAAIAIENARLYHAAIEKGRLERELQVARQVQAALLPQEAPVLPGWDFAARWLPATQVAGDYFDFIQHPDGRLGLVVADVTDKGMPVALFMALTRSTLRAAVYQAPSPQQGLEQANRLICADAMGGMFVTLFYGALDPAAARLAYVNAGHNPPLHYSAAQQALTPLARTGMALGVLADAPYAQAEVELAPGDSVLLYTDGVTDALNPQGAEFGLARLEQILLDNPTLPAGELLDCLAQAIGDFTGSGRPFDDITLLAVRRSANHG